MAVFTPMRSRNRMRMKTSSGFLLRNYRAVREIQVMEDRVRKKKLTQFLAKEEGQMRKMKASFVHPVIRSG